MKKTLSVVLAALLLCTLCVVFAAADEPTASDYVFGVDNVNALAGETTNIYTYGENLNAWAVIILLDKVEDNLYKVSGTPDVGAGDPRNITLADGQILLVVHSSTNDPAQADQYPNCFDKNAAMALTDGMFVQLSGIDLTVDGAVENGTATCTVEDPRTADSSSEAEPSEAVSSEAEPSEAVSSEAASSVAASSEAVSSSEAESSKSPDTSDAGVTALIIVALSAIAVTVTVIRKRS